MKINGYLYLFFILFLGSCEKDHSVCDKASIRHRKESIVTGETGDHIYYRDIDPDWEKHGFGLLNDSLNIDVNGDYIPDVSIQYTSFLSGTEYEQQTSVSCMNGAFISLAPKNQGDVIDAYSEWTSSASLLCFTKINFISSDTTYTGSWNGISDKYLGVRIRKNRPSLFGWIKMSLLVPPSIVYVQQVIVKEYACQKAY